MERKKITLPLTRELARTLHAGDQVLLTGTIYTSRDAGHKRMCEALAKGEKIPFDPTDATIYYVGPTPAKPGAVIGSAGPTTSGRMDAYAPTMMSVGARGMIGKGARLPDFKVPGAGTLTVTFTPEDGSEPIEHVVYNYGIGHCQSISMHCIISCVDWEHNG